ncbi:MAG: hypothetical protein EOP00_35480 [Pedobacter sp.]|nr:MAG: hypothetical protein EOP00_35480 [Pedobacter sp.]
MKIKVSDIVGKEVARSGKTRTAIANDIGISTVQLRKILKEELMEMKYVVAIGKSIRVDFGKYFPELNAEKLGNILHDPEVPYEAMGNTELRDKIIEIQDKYVKLLEEHINLLKEIKLQH